LHHIRGEKTLGSEPFVIPMMMVNVYLVLTYFVLSTAIKALHMISHLVLPTYELRMYYCPHLQMNEMRYQEAM
jgi:hypothetical protein